MRNTWGIIAGENGTYTGREYFALNKGYYLSKMVVNEEVTVSGLIIQDENANNITSQFIGAGVTKLNIGQVITFKRPVYRVFTVTGSLSFYLSRAAAPLRTFYLLDKFQGAAAAYSLRKLRNGYTGAAIRVRESATNTEADIGFNADGTLNTTALLAHVGANNGFVVTWYDQSGNGYNATQSTAANQPQIVSSGSVILENSKPTLKFDGTNDSLFLPVDALDFGNGVTDLPLSLFSTIKRDVILTHFPILSKYTNVISSTAQYTHSIQNTNIIAQSYYDNDIHQRISGTGNTTIGIDTNLITFIYDAGAVFSSLSMWVDGVSQTISNTSAGTYVAMEDLNIQASIGVRLQNFSPPQYGNGKIYELIAYPSDQSANRTAIESNINAFYNIYP